MISSFIAQTSHLPILFHVMIIVFKMSGTKGIPVWEIMQLTSHKTSRSVNDFYRSESILQNQAADML